MASDAVAGGDYMTAGLTFGLCAVVATLAIPGNTGMTEGCRCPGHGGMASDTVAGGDYMTAGFAFGLVAVVTTLAIAGNAGMTESCRCPCHG